MSASTFLDELLDGAEVTWITLAAVTFPTSNIKWKAINRVFRYIDLGSVDMRTRSITDTSEIVESNAPSRAQKIVEKDDVIFATTRPTQMRSCLISDEYAGEVASTGYCVLRADREIVLPKWILYWVSSSEFKTYLEKQQSGSAYPAISDKKVKEFEIPIPCPENPKKSLAIQSEIVRILDTFTELTTELTTELNARKKQYNYYRDELLTFESVDMEWKALGDVGKFIRGKRFTKADYVETNGIHVIHYGEIYTRYGTSATHAVSQVRAEMADSLRYVEPGDVVFTDVGETVDEVGKAMAWLGNEKVAIHDHCYALRHSMNPKYIAYCMQTASFIAQKAKYVARTKINTLLVKGFSKVQIPVPYPNDTDKSLAEQARIVAILDKFDTLTHSISEGLPREIELRRKQYEYYRDLLLSFPKPEQQPEIVA